MVYFIPTPIGNLEDISQRSLNLLMRVSYIFCEDTRVTKKLISLLEQRYNLKNTPKHYISFHSHNEKEVIQNLSIDTLKTQDHAFVSDAGMPCISDPGALMVKFCQDNGIDYEVYSGANALLVAVASSGFEQNEFSFFGFLPHKGRERVLKLNEVLNSNQSVILYEAPHRIEQLANELAVNAPQRRVFFIKEISKKHEKKYFGKACDVEQMIKEANQKGEWVVVVEKNPNPTDFSPLNIDDIMGLTLKPKQKAKLLSKLTGKSTEIWYKKLTN